MVPYYYNPPTVDILFPSCTDLCADNDSDKFCPVVILSNFGNGSSFYKIK